MDAMCHFSASERQKEIIRKAKNAHGSCEWEKYVWGGVSGVNPPLLGKNPVRRRRAGFFIVWMKSF